MRTPLDLRLDLPRLTPCAARLTELLLERLPDICSTVTVRLSRLKNEHSRSELDLIASSPSEQVILSVETSSEGVELRFSEKGKSGSASALFFMHPLNFHRTCEAAVDFVDKVAHGQIIVARERKRIIPLFGPKRLRFFDAGEIVGSKAALIEKVLVWRNLHHA